MAKSIAPKSKPAPHPGKFSYAVFLLILPALFYLASCTTYQPFYADPESQSGIRPIPADSIDYTIFLVGDLAYKPRKKRGKNPLLPLLKEEIMAAGKNSTTVFLGDNLLPNSANPDPAGLLPMLKDYPGKRFFLPGNLEWSANKPVKHLRALEKQVEEKVEIEGTDAFIPDDACSGPEIEDLTEDISLVGFDSQWWLENWNRDPAINSKCEIKDREAFLLALREEIKGMKDKTIILAAHHPMYANGPKGGNYSLKQHLFPLTDLNKNLFVPLPGIGSIYYFLRSGSGFPGELSHPHFRAFHDGLLDAVGKDNKVIFAAAHEHALQYNEKENRHFILSGTGATADRVTRGEDAEFAYGRQGFSRILFLADGSVWVAFYTLGEDNRTLQLSYQQRMIEDRFAPQEAVAPPVPIDTVIADSVKVPVYTGDNAKETLLYQMVFGKRYRAAYFEPIQMPRIHLDDVFGELKPYKRGGGQQTQSLRLKNAAGKEFAMRSIRKNPILLLPVAARESFAVDLLRDQFTGAHPFAVFTIPRMADAIGIYHTNPLLAYVPKHKALEDYNDTFGGEMYMIEERPDGNWEELASFGHAEELISTNDVWEAMYEDWSKRVDQELFVRNRLFDGLIGDWDRHSDQWRWKVVEKENGRTVYEPIPRDRDQVYSDYDGFVAGMLALLAPGLRKMQPFRDEIGSPKWGTENGRRNDRLLLNELEWEDWKKQIEHIRENLTDEVIEKAIRDMPPEIFELNREGERIIAKLKSRRDNLMEYGRKLYELRAEDVDVVGTTKDDFFVVTYLPEGRINVIAYDQSDEGEKDEKFYERTFLPGETKEIRIYGLDGDDKYQLEGKNSSSIILRLVGDVGDDEYTDQAEQAGGKKALIYEDPAGYDKKADRGNFVLKSSRIRDRNQYDFYQYEYDFVAPLPRFGYNPDDGLFLGLGIHRRTFGFKKDPYRQDHRLSFSIATNTLAIDVDYSGDFIEFFGYRNDLLLHATYESPQFVVNYFGMGNDSENLVDERSYNRVRRTLAGVYPAFKHRFRSGTTFSAGPVYETVSVEKTPMRIFSEPKTDVPERVFSRQSFSGVDAVVRLNSIDNVMVPTQGLVIFLNGGWKININEKDRDFYYFNSDLRFYRRFWNKHLFFATRIGLSHVEGKFDFFQAPNLGGLANLRGYRNNRFYGNTAFYHNTDLRLPILPVKNRIMPFTLGFYAGFDHGRVWLEGEDSDTWHYGYGGGLVISPLNMAVMTAGLFHSPEGNRFTVNLGFDF